MLTGALKLFFRELKEPLIPWECVGPLLAAANDQSSSARKHRARRMREIVTDVRSGVPPAHRGTLAHLLRHLLRVTAEREHNRMQIPNLAIVFGPTLMWPPPPSSSSAAATASSAAAQQQNLALDMMQQNIIVEALLTNFEAIFGQAK